MKLVFGYGKCVPIVKYMAGLLTGLLRAMGRKSRKKLKEKTKKIVERDRVLYNKLAKAS